MNHVLAEAGKNIKSAVGDNDNLWILYNLETPNPKRQIPLNFDHRTLPSLFLGFFSALLLIFSFPKPNLEILVWFGMVPLFIAVRNKSPKVSFFLSYITGFLFFSGVIYWLTNVSFFGYVMLVLYLSVYFGLFGFFVNMVYNFSINNKLSTINFKNVSVIFIPCLWVSLEFIRSHLFTGFGWALLGYSQYLNLPVIQISDKLGAYGVSFLIVMVNVSIFQLIQVILQHRRQKSEDRGPRHKNWRVRLWRKKSEVPATKIGGSAFGGRNQRSVFRISSSGYWLLVSGFFLIGSLSYGFFKLNKSVEGEKIRISIIQGNISQEMKGDLNFIPFILAKYEKLTKLAHFDNPDLIVWPEAPIPVCLDSEPELLARISNLTKDVKTFLLIGASRTSGLFEDRYFNSAVLFSEKGEIKKIYDKLHLVPFGEYIPWGRFFSFVRKFYWTIGDYAPGTEYTLFEISLSRQQLAPPLEKITTKFRGGNIFYEAESSSQLEVDPPFAPEAHLPQAEERMSKSVQTVSPIREKSLTGSVKKFSVLICFEDIFQNLARRFVREGADFLINITDDSVFGENSAPYQHAQASVFRAVENRVNLVRCTNTGFSCFINPNGEIIDKVSDEKGKDIFIAGYKTCDIKISEYQTFYTKFGDIFAILCLVISILGLVCPSIYAKYDSGRAKRVKGSLRIL